MKKRDFNLKLKSLKKIKISFLKIKRSTLINLKVKRGRCRQSMMNRQNNLKEIWRGNWNVKKKILMINYKGILKKFTEKRHKNINKKCRK